MLTEAVQPKVVSRKWGLWVFLFALVLRLVYFAWSQSSPYLFQVSTDEAFYVDYARALLDGHHYAYANFMDPMLSWLIALPLLLTDNLHLARFGMLLLDSANATLLYIVALQLTASRKAAMAAGLLYAIYSLTLVYSVMLTKAVPVITLLLAITACLLAGIETGRRLYILAAGAFSALLIFLGASFIVLAPVYAVVLLAVRKCRPLVPAYAAGFAALLLAYAGIWQLADSRKTLLPTNGGIVFYIANHAGNPWGTHSHPAFVAEATPTGIYHAFRDEAMRRNPAITTDQQVSAFWYRQALAENLQEPGLSMQRLLHKWLLLLADDEISQNYFLPYIRQETLKGIPLPGFALVFGFGLAGFLVLTKRDVRLGLVLAPVGVTFIICSLFFVSARMRLPMVPFLMLGCAWWFAAPPVGKVRWLAAALAICAMAASFTASAFISRPSAVNDKYSLALVMVHARMFVEAETLVDEALQLETNARLLALKAVIKSYQGQCDKALPLYDQALAMDNTLADMRENREVCARYLQQHTLP